MALFLEKKLLNIKCIIWFFLQFLSETFLILRIIQQDTILMYTGLHIKYLLCLSDFNITWIFWQIFKKYQFHKNLSSGCIDRHDKAVTFQNFANVPKKQNIYGIQRVRLEVK
jgi:hypothetical protein